MNWLDIAIIAPLLFGLIMGLIRGLVSELNAILSVLLGILGVRLFGPAVAAWIRTTTEWHMEICVVVGYTVLFLTIVIVLHLLGKLVQRLLHKIQLGWVNRLLGALCGTLKWTVIVLFLVFLVGQLDHQFGIMPKKAKQESMFYQKTLNSANHCINTIKDKRL